jgi:hypothetical protein
MENYTGVERRKHNCMYEERWGKVLTQLENITDKVCTHIKEGEKEGGYRDRLLIAEKEICVIKKGYWKACLVSGVIGGLLGKLSPDLLSFLFKAVFAQ